VKLGISFVLALCIATSAFAQPNTSMPVNPLIQQRADPHIFRHSDGYYYLTATVPEYDRIVLRRARTIAGLSTAEEQVIWRRHAQGEMAVHIWAPEIHFIDGKWYIYFTAGRSDDIWAIRLYVLENAASDPRTGSWVEKGQLKTAFETFSLDATTFEHQGKRYLVWTQRPPEPKGAGTDIYIARMRNPWSIEQPQVSISSPTFEWEVRGHKVNEAPAVIVRNERVFVTFSASATDANYCIGLLTADENADLLDRASWKKSPLPVFVSNDATSQYGPGHNSFTIAEDGKTDVLVYHARNYKEIKGEPLNDPNRHSRVQVLEWNADGTPRFGVPVKDGPVRLIAGGDR
jgi:GH43 family beta-xylosidase